MPDEIKLLGELALSGALIVACGALWKVLQTQTNKMQDHLLKQIERAEENRLKESELNRRVLEDLSDQIKKILNFMKKD